MNIVSFVLFSAFMNQITNMTATRLHTQIQRRLFRFSIWLVWSCWALFSHSRLVNGRIRLSFTLFFSFDSYAVFVINRKLDLTIFILVVSIEMIHFFSHNISMMMLNVIFLSFYFIVCELWFVAQIHFQHKLHVSVFHKRPAVYTVTKFNR